jgi:hypothetical protein
MAKKSKPKRKAVKRKRNYKAEYRRRLALGQRRGKTIQEARGAHPKEKRAKRHRPGKVAKKFFTGRWEVGTMVRATPAEGFKWDTTRQTYVRKIPDLRTYHLTLSDAANAKATAERLARNASRNYDIFSVRMLCTDLPYGNAVLKYGWTEPQFVQTKDDLFNAIYHGFPGSPGYWGLKDDEPDEGRRTLIIALAIT